MRNWESMSWTPINRLTCKWKNVQDVARGDVVEVGGRPYDVVTNAQPDGTGMALLALAVQQR